MPLFKKSKSSSNNHPHPPAPPSPGSPYSARSAEHLIHPASAPPDHSSSSIEDAYSDRRFSDPRCTQDEASPPHPHPQPHPQPHPRQYLSAQPPSETIQSSLHRSQSQRQPRHSQHNRASVINPVVPEDSQPRRITKESRSVWPSSGFLGRSVSVKGKSSSRPISQPTSPRVPRHLDTTEEEHHFPPSYSENQSPVTSQTRHPYEPRSATLAYQPQHQPFRGAPRENPEWSQQPPASAQSLIPPPLERSSTDTSLLERYKRPVPVSAPESPLHPPDQDYRGQSHSRIQQGPVLNARSPSRLTYESLSPVLSQNHPDAMQTQGQQTSNDRSQGSQQDPSRRDSASQNMPEPGRNTPTSNRSREEPSEIDVRALLQKHEELRMLTYEPMLDDAN